MTSHLFTLGLLFAFLYYSQSQVTFPNSPIRDALYLHNMSISNYTLRDCSFRPMTNREMCPDPDVHYYLYNEDGRQVVEYSQTDWLRQSIWDPNKEDVMLVHGYAGGDGVLPMSVLKDAYLKNGSFNVWIVDWGALCYPPCYRAAVHNLRAVARCTGQLLTSLRNQGLRNDKMTCIGHSLGAHVCGLISKYILFRLHRVVGLDPARPLITPGVRISSSAAGAVHVLHTNAGHYGESGRGGHVDFCINGGKIQPYCENSGFDEQLCSHVWSVCYMAASINPELARRAEPCSRRCPTGPLSGNRAGIPILMGQYTPLNSAGSYCVRDDYPPYCPDHSGGLGDVRCCLRAPQIVPPVTESMEAID